MIDKLLGSAKTSNRILVAFLENTTDNWKCQEKNWDFGYVLFGCDLAYYQ